MSVPIPNEWLGVIITFVVAALFLSLLYWSLQAAKKPLSVEVDGWIETRNSIFDHVIGVVQFCFSVVWLFFGLLSPFFLDEFNLGAIAFFILMLVMGVWFMQSFLYVYCAKIRFNNAKLEYRAFGKTISVYWDSVKSIRVGQNGPKITTLEGCFSISNLRQGFYQLIEMARDNGVDIQNSPYLKSPGSHSFFKKKNK